MLSASAGEKPPIVRYIQALEMHSSGNLQLSNSLPWSTTAGTLPDALHESLLSLKLLRLAYGRLKSTTIRLQISQNG